MDTARFSRALAYACAAHDGQVRKGTDIPFIAHLLGVAGIALEHGANDDEAIGALLHDTAEDAGGEERLADVRAQFGPAVADIVAGCSDTFETPKPPWRARKEAYIAHLASASRSVLLVSASDKLHNVRSLEADVRIQGDPYWARFNGGKAGSLWYYDTLATRFVALLPGKLSTELRRATDSLLASASGGPARLG